MGERYLNFVRSQIIGSDLVFKTPFGLKNMFYADYTASGRSLRFIEDLLLDIQRHYANTHTEDDYSGKYLTRLFHQAEACIKKLVNAGEHGRVFSIGSGSTGALKKLQEIIGVYIPPLTRERFSNSCLRMGKHGKDVLEFIDESRPVVFIGPYEHHTNELMWREAFVEVVVIGLDSRGWLDLEDLERKMSNRRYGQRVKFGSFSAGSNVTGVQTPVYDVARICHQHNTAVFFDFAAVAPYDEIDMNRDRKSYFDAVFFSPHKYLGGPGSSGILVIHDRLYRKDLPPTTAGGGTVVYVGFEKHDYAEDIETREMAGTPPILQTIKAALAMEVKEKIGLRTIARLERRNLLYFIGNLDKINKINLIGRYDTGPLTPIVSFNIAHDDRILHPKFVTKLLNDLFGIQSRAGCSCAGPYGHVLLGIDRTTSDRLRGLILRGRQGIKPGWVRVNIHYTLTTDDIDFLLEAIAFIAEYGHLFLHEYAFDFRTGEWRHLGFKDDEPRLTLDGNFKGRRVDLSRIESHRASYFRQAEQAAKALKRKGAPRRLRDAEEVEKLKSFYYAHRV